MKKLISLYPRELLFKEKLKNMYKESTESKFSFILTSPGYNTEQRWLVYLGHCQTSMMQLFCTKAALQMFDMVFKMLPNTTGDNIEELNDNGTYKAKKNPKKLAILVNKSQNRFKHILLLILRELIWNIKYEISSRFYNIKSFVFGFVLYSFILYYYIVLCCILLYWFYMPYRISCYALP